MESVKRIKGFLLTYLQIIKLLMPPYKKKVYNNKKRYHVKKTFSLFLQEIIGDLHS